MTSFVTRPAEIGVGVDDDLERVRVSDAFLAALQRLEVAPGNVEPGDNGRLVMRHRDPRPSSFGECVLE